MQLNYISSEPALKTEFNRILYFCISDKTKKIRENADSNPPKRLLFMKMFQPWPFFCLPPGAFYTPKPRAEPPIGAQRIPMYISVRTDVRKSFPWRLLLLQLQEDQLPNQDAGRQYFFRCSILYPCHHQWENERYNKLVIFVFTWNHMTLCEYNLFLSIFMLFVLNFLFFATSLNTH